MAAAVAGLSRKLVVVLALLALAGGAALLVWRPWQEEETDIMAIFAPQRPAAPPAERQPAAEPDRPPDEAALAAAVRDTVGPERLRAAYWLGERSDIPAGRRTALLLVGLEREVATPTTGQAPVGSYLPLTSFIRLQFLRVIEGLGSDAAPTVRAAVQSSSGEAREWAILALGSADAGEAVPQLRGLLRGSKDGVVRMTAARLLGQLQAREAIPDLEAALLDPFTATASSDAGPPPAPFFPVRGQAAAALEELGRTVERRGDTFTVTR